MKKNIFYVGALFLGLILGTSCSEEDGLVKNKQTLVEATINNPASRTTVSSDYKVVWSQDDAYTVWSSEGIKKGELTLATGEGSTTGSFTGTLNPALANGDVALFPSVSGDSKSYTFKSEYSTTETDAPMLGTYNGTSFSFNHLAAFIRVNANDLPAGDAVLTITSANQALTGEATLTTEDALIPSGEGKTITVTFTAEEGQDLVFDAPIPAQAYDKITLTLKVGETEFFQKERALNAVVGNLYELTSTKQMTVEEANTVLVGLKDNKSLNVNISGLTDDATIAVPTAEGSVLNMDISNVAVGKSIIINNNAGESVGESQQNIGVNVANNESSAIDMTINTPTATVEVGEGYFTTVTATTATNTLIVGKGVTITTLNVQGGNVVIEAGATVGTITNNVSGNTITEHVISLEALNAAIEKGYNVILGADITASDIIVINKPITLDGNGHTLTSSAGRAINVSGADANGVTIKNLIIEASGERAINIIQNATNVTIDNVTATAANYTINVAGSAPSAKVEIKNSILSGLCTVNVSAASADVEVDNSTINCNDHNTTAGEAYAALSLNKDAVGGKITATNTTINVVDGSDSFKGRNGAENGEVTINGSTAGVVVMVAYITYPGSDYYHAFATLAKAVEFAKEGDVIQLISKVTLTESLEIPSGKTVTLDLNGKTISQEKECTTSYSMIKNKGNLTINGNGTISFKDLSNGGGDTWGSYVVENNGTLVVENVTLKHFGSADGDHDTNLPIQNYKGKVIINGGTISSVDFRSLRDYTAGGEIIINGGKFEGQVWMQGLGNGSSSLTINGGEFEPVSGYDGSSVYITNGTNSVNVSITGGKFNTKIGTANATKDGVKGCITGGIFTKSAKENTNSSLLKDGYIFVEGADGNYTVAVGN